MRLGLKSENAPSVVASSPRLSTRLLRFVPRFSRGLLSARFEPRSDGLATCAPGWGLGLGLVLEVVLVLGVSVRVRSRVES